MADIKDSQPALEYFSRALRLSFLFLKVLVAVLVLYYILFSGFFTVRQDEVAVVLRWGRIVGVGEGRILQPGFHWSFPKPIDRVIKIPVRKVKSVGISEFWSADLEKKEVSPPQLPQFLVPYLHGYSITGDSNLIHTKWTINYNITDPVAYITRIEDEEAILKAVVSSAVTETVGNFSVDEALRTRLDTFSRRVWQEAQRKLDGLESGITIVGVYLDRSVPPLQVVEAFNEVIKAEQIKSSLINEAEAYKNRQINTAKGEASRIIAEARTYKNEVVNEARADAEYIIKLTQRFQQGSEELNTYISYFYQEKMQQILENLKGKFILHRPIPGREDELRIILGKGKGWEGAK